MKEIGNDKISMKFKIAAIVSIGIIVAVIICSLVYLIWIIKINPIYDPAGNYTEEELHNIQIVEALIPLMIVSIIIGLLNIPAFIIGFRSRTKTYEMKEFSFYRFYGIRGIIVGCLSLNAFMIYAGVATLNYSKQKPKEETEE